MVREIQFKKNWNHKLDCEIFGDYRLWNSKKERYFSDGIGDRWAIKLFGRLKCIAILKSVRKTTLGKEPIEILIVNTGSENPLEFFRKQFGWRENDPLIYLRVVRCVDEKNVTVQRVEQGQDPERYKEMHKQERGVRRPESRL